MKGVRNASGSTILNLGCGKKPVEGAVNLDITPDTKPDIVHDLNEFPWPFDNARFASILAHDVIEHLGDIVQTMEEIHRICQPGATIDITVPHFSSSNAFTDPTHRHYFGYFSFDYFTGGHEHSYYTRQRFRMLRRQIVFYPTLANRVVHRAASRWPSAYERRWAWRFPAWFLSFQLGVEK